MTNSKTTQKALFGSVAVLLLCFTMLLGTTFAWFTDTATTGRNIIQSGNLDVVLAYKTSLDDEWKPVDAETKIFDDAALWEPGYTEVVYLKVENAGSLALKYQMDANIVAETEGTNVAGETFKLSDYLRAASEMYGEGVLPAEQMLETVLANRLTDREAFNTDQALKWSELKDIVWDGEFVLEPGQANVGFMVINMPTTVGNEANHNGTNVPKIELGLNVVATQHQFEEDSFGSDYDKDAEYPVIAAPWDGSADTSWYNDGDTEFTLSSAAQLAGLAQLVDEGNTFEGKTVKLGGNIDLYAADADGEPVSFDPIGDKSPFAGTFDGQGNTISNLYQSGWAFGYEWGSYGSIGLFGELENATVKNLTLKGAESLVEGGDVGGITGSATGDCVFENITLEDSVFATYNNGNGGIIGWSGEGNYTFKNITIAEDVVLAGLWGSFDSSIGGVVGQGEPGATYNFENVNIDCRLDVYNDCTASYDYYNYRMCGMIIGRLEETTTIDGTNYPDMSKYNITCNDVTVTYGEWANYHYCEPTPGLNNGRGMRVEAGYAYDGLPADYDHSQCVDNHMNLIPFDQIFGGDQLGVKGLKEYDGVTVVYNNK